MCGNGGDKGKKTEPKEPELSVVPQQLTVPEEAGSAYITVTSNVEWSLTSSKDWCAYTPYMGYEGETRVKITTTANYTGANRTATLTFASGSYTQEYTVVQTGTESQVVAPAGYTLVWFDEFNDKLAGGKATLPSTDNWWFETGAGGWGNNEIQNYIDRVSGTDTCAFISDGALKIVAKKRGNEVLSVRMNTKQSWLYGYFEARLKLPQGKGTWPAFWMLPQNFQNWPDDGEIDIMEEVGYRPNWVASSIHCKAYYHSIGTQKSNEKYIATAESDFHIYAVEWTPDVIKGFIDGEKYFEFPNDKKGKKDTWPFNAPFYLKLNLAWGGNWGGAEGVDNSALPATYEIDYVRVFQKSNL
ncbi:beta-glucanase [Bacteroidia bacterium]|nr:beta-glucanase [Bacteroidia bacterium]